MLGRWIIAGLGLALIPASAWALRSGNAPGTTVKNGEITVARPVNIQTFSGNGTWEPPTSFTPVTVYVWCVGPGGGGGGGAAGTNTVSGGSGGGAGGICETTLRYEDIGTASVKSLSVTLGGVGQGGGSAAQGAGGGTTSVAGTVGGTTTTVCAASPGGQGSPGVTAQATASINGGAGGRGYPWLGMNGGQGIVSPVAGSRTNNALQYAEAGNFNAYSAGGGGGGGGVVSSVAYAGGQGGQGAINPNLGAAGGTPSATQSVRNGVAGQNPPGTLRGFRLGNGGGGGAGGLSTAGGNGGVGGTPGGGGGGGGGSSVANSGGAGGNGGPSMCVIVSYG